MNELTIRGSKGGSDSAHTPVESPDSLINTSYANILDGISEGPIVGLVNGARSIYLDETPLAGSDGTLNFSGVTWEQRYGEHDQDYITGFPSVETEHAVGVELTNTQAWTQSLSNVQLSGVRIRLGASSLYQQNSDGDTGGFTVKYAIELSTDGADFVTVVDSAFTGKTTTGYQRSHRVDLPAAEEGWTLRVRRTTPDYTDAKIGDTTTVVSYTEVIDAKLQYPYTALVGLKIDASQFSSIPARAFRIRGRIIQVPSNYDPVNRSYGGTWDGTFKLAWTDCPPWIYRDIILNDRYGLGRFISSENVDKWELYQIAQYCDALVDDGKGGKEPRFTCNLYLQSRADALQVLQDMASIFRGMAYYAGSQVVASADMPSDPVYTYTNSNVIGGSFTRVGSAGSTRYSVAKVSWTDRDNFGAQRVEYVQNQRSIARYGIRETEITAFGCVSQGQAQRLGHYTLLTNQVETGTIQFSVGLDGTLARPGQIIRVADQHFAGKPIGGRVKAATAESITVDDELTVAAGDKLVVIQPNGVAQTRIIRVVTGRIISVTEDFDAAPIAESVYAIETAQVVPETYRILSIAENFGDDKLQYDIVAVQHNASKFAAIDSGAQIVNPPTTTLPDALQAMPSNVQLSTYDAVKQGLTVATMRVTWDPAKGAQSYNAWWKKDSGDWIYAGITYTAAIEISGIYSGTYTARVSAVGVSGNASLWAYSAPTPLQGKIGLPPAVTSITTESLLFGIGAHWTFPPGAEDTQRTELWYSPGTDVTAATKLSDLAYPQSDYVLQNLRAGAAFFFWARLVDRSGNVGPFYPAGVGVRGEASSDAGAILDQIAGQVGESALGKELAAEIGLISGIGPGSVNERLDEAKALADEARARLGEQIAAVDTELDGVKTELQQQIDAIAELADSMPYKADQTYTAGQGSLGADGIIYQAIKAVPINTPPPNTTYWLNVGQAVATANGLATRVQTVETKVTSVEGVNTSQAQQITGLRTDVDGKASASSVQSIGNRVTTAENSISSQGSAITGLNNSLTTTNTNVGTAQTAANNAAALAGSKGKVLVQTAAPAAADQLAQNLWIDITGGANTPKRWNGSVWAPVTDKVATDAAAAAASALTQVQTKADAAAVSALTNRVTATEGAITTQSSNITNLNNSLSNAGGENLAYNPDFNRAASAANDLPEGYLLDAPNVPGSSTGIFALVPSFMNSAEKAQRITVTGLNVSSLYRSIRNAPNKLPKIAGGQPVCSSIYVRGTPGLGFRIFIQQVTAAGALILTTNTIMYYLTGAQQRIALNVPTPADNAAQLVMFYRVYGSETVSDGFIEMARPQVEYGSTPTGWTNNGQVDAADLIATSNAVASLGSTVSQQGALITSSSQDITTLNNVIYRTGDNNPARIYQSVFTDLALDKWGLDGGNPASTAKATFSKLAGNTLGATLTLDSTSNLESWWGSSSRRIRFDPTRLYKLTVRIQQVSKNGRDPAMYLGVHAYNEDGVQLNVSGSPSKVSSHYILAAAAKLPEGVWTTFTVYLKGHSLAGETGGMGVGTIADPKRLIGGTSYFSPMALTGHPVMGGVAAIDYFIIEDATEQSQIDASASALQALTSSVTQQGTSLTSVSGRTTNLENIVNSSTTGLATKASSSAVNNLSSRVSTTEGAITSQSNDITLLKNTIGSAGSFVAGVSFEFLNSNQGWAPQTAGATMTLGPLFSTLNKYTTVQRNGMSIDGSENPFLRFRFRRRNTTRITGSVYWANQDGGLAEARRANFTITGSEDWQDVEIDLSTNTGWVGKTITSIRLDFMNSSDATAIVDIGYVAAGRRSAAASAQAVSALTSEVTQQGATLTSQATQVASLQTAVGNANTAIQTEITARTNADTALGRRVDTVQSSVASANALIQSESSTRANADAALGQRIDTVQSFLGNTNASVQQTSTALAGLNGQVNAQYSVKVMSTTSGMKVAAGFGLGLESEGGVTQSTFAVSADRFVVLNSNLGGGATLSSPFAVENGQVFIADAYIKKATIQQGIVGQGLYSQTFTNYGSPVMNVDFDAGQILIQNRTTNGAYMFIRQDGIFMVQNGVVVVELSMG
jgi:predicted phage tail protein